MQAEPNLRRKDQAVWLNRLEDDLDNLRSALEWSLATRIEAGLELGAALQWFWHIRGRGSEGVDWLSQLLEAEARTREDQPLEPGRSLARANALNAGGFLMDMQNNPGQSRLLFKESLGIFRGLGQAGRRGMAISLLGLADPLEDVSETFVLAEESMAIFRELGDKFYIAECLQQIGGILSIQGRFTDAKSAIEEDLALRKEINDQDGMGTAYHLYGNLEMVQGDYSHARELFEKSLACYRVVNNVRFITQVIYSLARVIGGPG